LAPEVLPFHRLRNLGFRAIGREPAGRIRQLTVMSDQLMYTMTGTVLLFAAVVLLAAMQLI
jgi:hypothetical protein